MGLDSAGTAPEGRQIHRGGGDANVSFDELRGLLRHLGFEEKVRGTNA